MSLPSQTRALLRALKSAPVRPTVLTAAFGGVVALAVGGAYMGGVAAQDATVRDKAERIKDARVAGLTEEALAAAAGGLDASALTIARRHDPYTVAGSAQRDRQAELLTARLEQLRAGSDGLRRASLDTGPAARPFNLGGALDASRDLECLTQAVYYEARGEGRAGMQAVAQVVLNRARHPAFPKSVCGVVFQGSGRGTGCQFSFTCNGVMRGAVNRAAWNRARDIASQALSGQVYAGVGNATHFHTTAVAPSWRNSLVRVNQVGNHYFYRFGGRNGAANAFRYDPAPSTDHESPRLVQAGIDPVETARQATGAVAYTLVLAREGLTPDREQPQAEARRADVRPEVRAETSAAPRVAVPAIAAPAAPTPAVAVKPAAPAAAPAPTEA